MSQGQSLVHAYSDWARSAGTNSLQCGHLNPRCRSVWPSISSAVKVFLQCGQTTSWVPCSAARSAMRSRYLREVGAVLLQRCTLGRRRLAALGAEVNQAEEPLAVGEADRVATRLRPQHARRAPVP